MIEAIQLAGYIGLCLYLGVRWGVFKAVASGLP